MSVIFFCARELGQKAVAIAAASGVKLEAAVALMAVYAVYNADAYNERYDGECSPPVDVGSILVEALQASEKGLDWAEVWLGMEYNATCSRESHERYSEDLRRVEKLVDAAQKRVKREREDAERSEQYAISRFVSKRIADLETAGCVVRPGRGRRVNGYLWTKWQFVLVEGKFTPIEELEASIRAEVE